MTGNSYTVDTLPSPLPFYLKVFRPRSGFRDGDHIPQTSIIWNSFEFDEKTVRDYATACGLRVDDGRIPLLFPHSYFGPLHLKMITDENFPSSMLGSLHLRNHLIQHKPLYLTKSYQLKLFFMGERRRPQGLEIDFKTEIYEGNSVAWESVSTLLVRKKFKHEDGESELAGRLVNLEQALVLNSFKVPRNTGKRFGMITKDINPIHMSRLLAKAFGFKRDLCHGMWALGKSLNYLEGVNYDLPVRNDVAFKGPLYMEQDITIKTNGTNSDRFELFSGENSRPCVVGYLGNVPVGSSL